MKVFAFGPFVADPLLGVLRRDSEVVPLTPKGLAAVVDAALVVVAVDVETRPPRTCLPIGSK